MKFLLFFSIALVVVVSLEGKKISLKQSSEQGMLTGGVASTLGLGKSKKAKAAIPPLLPGGESEGDDTAGELLAHAPTLPVALPAAPVAVPSASQVADLAAPVASAAEGAAEAIEPEAQEELTTAAPKKTTQSPKAALKAKQAQGKKQDLNLATKSGLLSVKQKDAQKQSFEAGGSGKGKGAAAGKQKQKQKQSVSIED